MHFRHIFLSQKLDLFEIPRRGEVFSWTFIYSRELTSNVGFCSVVVGAAALLLPFVRESSSCKVHCSFFLHSNEINNLCCTVCHLQNAESVRFGVWGSLHSPLLWGFSQGPIDNLKALELLQALGVFKLECLSTHSSSMRIESMRETSGCVLKCHRERSGKSFCPSEVLHCGLMHVD